MRCRNIPDRMRCNPPYVVVDHDFPIGFRLRAVPNFYPNALLEVAVLIQMFLEAQERYEMLGPRAEKQDVVA